MNKESILQEVEKVVGSKKEAEAAVNCIIASIFQALKERDSVKLTGFGTFKTELRKARPGRNPKTGETILIEERFVPKFVPAKALKDLVD